ncbi:hypothetical protein E6O75_ATG03442 [Venturia nashicola]|uniref:Uncharacterized protein n=1 Tax=Venturia nashicola TaxID=86259 RepID=A0A4Z1PF39_9PEZI|nr:hypothetical protein E6O75_ATG03442 [Venturia nashicola]
MKTFHLLALAATAAIVAAMPMHNNGDPSNGNKGIVKGDEQYPTNLSHDSLIPGLVKKMLNGLHKHEEEEEEDDDHDHDHDEERSVQNKGNMRINKRERVPGVLGFFWGLTHF